MTPSEAKAHELAIKERVARTAPSRPPQPPGWNVGALRAGPHPEYAAHWTVFWHPARRDLRPIDLEEFSIEAAAEQVARYGQRAYPDVRRRLEAILTGLESEAMWPDPRPDSFMVGSDTLSIVEEDHGHGRQPTFRIELETDSLPQAIASGEPVPESSYVDVTSMEIEDVVRLLKDRAVIRP